jgi:type III secretory pathway component EscS
LSEDHRDEVESLLELWLQRFVLWILVFVGSLLSPIFLVFGIGVFLGILGPVGQLLIYAGYAWPQVALGPIAIMNNQSGELILREGSWIVSSLVGWSIVGVIHALAAVRQQPKPFALSVIPLAATIALSVKLVVENWYDVSYVIEIL